MMKKVAFLILSSLAFALFSTHFTVAYAQTLGTASLDGVDIASTPANPSPGNNVTINVTSYTTDLNGASINWIVSGKSFAKGTGMTSVTVQAPPFGKSVQILADVQTVEGADIQKVITIRSSSVDMIEETSGYVPPLYRGKQPFDYENTINIIAVPHLVGTNGVPLDPKTLIYTWKQDSTTLGDQSGYDKQSVSIKGAVISRPFSVTVDVSSRDGSVQGEGVIGITAGTPSILFYQDDPLYGVLYNEIVGNSVNLVHNQLKIASAPFGFDVGTDSQSLSYDWTVNDVDHPELASSTSIILQTPAGTSGTSNVDLTIQNANDILQSATGGFSAVFNDTSSVQSSQNTGNTTF